VFSLIFGTKRYATCTKVDHALTKFKFELDKGLYVIFVAPTQFRSILELNSV